MMRVAWSWGLALEVANQRARATGVRQLVRRRTDGIWIVRPSPKWVKAR